MVSFFQTATPIKYSLVVTAFCAGLLLLLLLIGLCYLQIPHVLATLLCCVSKTCFLRRKALQRNQDQTHLRVLYTASNSFEPAQAHLVPSAPTAPVVVPSHLPGQLPDQLPLLGTRPLAAQNFVSQGALCVRLFLYALWPRQLVPV